MRGFAYSAAGRDGAVLGALRSLAREEPLSVRVAGACMTPEVGEGATVAIHAQRFYWPGDVVAFRSSQGRLVLHRLIGYQRVGARLALVTQSDRGGGVDVPVPLADVLGRAGATTARARLRALGRFARHLAARIRGRGA